MEEWFAVLLANIPLPSLSPLGREDHFSAELPKSSTLNRTNS
jgi:hypothetical protein